MAFVGERVAARLDGLSWPIVYVALVVAYSALHYLFVSQLAHLLALLGVFLSVGVEAGVPATLLAFMLLFANNFFAAITPQGSSANVVFVGSGYLSVNEVYKYGAVVTFVNLTIYLAVGSRLSAAQATSYERCSSSCSGFRDDSCRRFPTAGWANGTFQGAGTNQYSSPPTGLL